MRLLVQPQHAFTALLPAQPRCRPPAVRNRITGCANPKVHEEIASRGFTAEVSGSHLVVKSLPPVRKAAPPPEPVPVQHSPAYLLRNRIKQAPDDFTLTKSRDEEPFTGNAVEWAVRRLDASLDEAEIAPPPGAKAIIDVARGPVGSATVQGVTAAARVTVKVGTTALKAAAPVGKWVVQQSLKAAVGMLSSGNSKSREKK